MTAHAPDLDQISHLRLFDPLATIEATARGLDSPELDAQLAVMHNFMNHTPQALCLLCEDPPRGRAARVDGLCRRAQRQGCLRRLQGVR
jgi:hypothetical protein